MLKFSFMFSFIIIYAVILIRRCETLESRIIGGHPIPIEKASYQVSIRVFENDITFGNGHTCGGSLISYMTVLTAAHCIHNRHPNTLRIVAGEESLKTWSKNTFLTMAVKIIVHPEYSNEKFEFDIALITMKDHIPSNHQTITPINIRNKQAEFGTSCQISGWGFTFLNGHLSGVLRAAIVIIQNTTICNGTQSYNGLLSSGMICAGPMEGGVDSCQGDSGGPLVCDGLLTGIVSFGLHCALKNTPGIYTDTVFYSKWIIENGAATPRTTRKIFPLFTCILLLLHELTPN